MNPRHNIFRVLLFVLMGPAFGWNSDSHAQTDVKTSSPNEKIARVFILAGQSNMTGQAVVDLDHPKFYNGGKGNLEYVMDLPANQERMAHLKVDGKWTKRDDVFVWYRTKNGLRAGPLTIGFTGYPDQHHFGPELQFGHVVGDAFEDPVLLIKTAWGGKSLNVDFRPPSAGGKIGPFYMKMLNEIGEAMNDATSKIESLKDHKLVLSGFVWQQGWNDMIDQQATAAYTDNLKCLIRDLRKQFDTPKLPVVVGELGNEGTQVNDNMKKFRRFQSRIIGKGLQNVRFVPTASFARSADESPNITHGHHWFGNAESYFLIGNALGNRMVTTIREQSLPKVLILGDSISMGYMPYVKQELTGQANVFRPMLTHKNGENCAGTDKGIESIDRWLKIEGGDWDVIHFNFGLHDLKRVKSSSGKNSNDPNDPYQSSPEEYRKQLRAIIQKLIATNAHLILTTTTPVPAGKKPVRPFRSPTDPPKYNKIAKELAKEFNLDVNDLFEFANSRLDEIQIPNNVHFTRDGSRLLGLEVARKLKTHLKRKSK